MRKRLRPAHTPEQLAQIYATPHDHTQWPDHIARVDATIAIAKALAGGTLDSAADLSCGSGAVLGALNVRRLHLGDYARGYEYVGPNEETIEAIPEVDMFVCTETLEHLDDPDAVLKAIRAKARMLVLSTPVDAWDDDNIEHYWAWSQADVEEMLAAAGFTVAGYAELDFRPYGLVYSFGVWGCR
jgi:hypothetical protein